MLTRMVWSEIKNKLNSVMINSVIIELEERSINSKDVGHDNLMINEFESH